MDIACVRGSGYALGACDYSGIMNAVCYGGDWNSPLKRNEGQVHIRKSRYGFTLIELLVVIAIIAVLIGI